MNIPSVIIAENELDTKQLALKFASIIKPGDIVCINGDLGSGKTFFIKSVAAQFGITESSSPSYTIVNEYSGTEKIIHIDFYRLNRDSEVAGIGFEDIINNTDSIIFIEWAYMFMGMLPKEHYLIEIKVLEDEKREFDFRKNG